MQPSLANPSNIVKPLKGTDAKEGLSSRFPRTNKKQILKNDFQLAASNGDRDIMTKLEKTVRLPQIKNIKAMKAPNNKKDIFTKTM